ncbi:extracellular solute-binding protein [Glycomyces tritici]|uniref:Extracellular solute-binding protein n=1 Tax=Glycomyces tritici TaxID=2665176 RepID=A0ABT7YUN2_9ACTN|nr:extracellular solute-binding protein [Glycomyces tritici]MDN3241560.1 extracellular solute-binding protein [Glycomyces tritici]MDN3242347.1 extracellular solute-binding protein [Glycomyces tritici]
MPDSSSAPMRRRSLFKVAGLGAVGAAGLPFAAACSDIKTGEGSTQATEGFDFLPEYKEWPLPAEPDLIGDPPNHPSAFTSYPEPVEAITEVPSNSGTYEITVPFWGEAPSNDDPYFAALRDAWGGTTINLRQADGNTYADTSVQWLNANEYGDGMLLFSWMLGSHTNFPETVVNTFYDLTDILKGDISGRWPLLAGLPTQSWAQSVWSTDASDPETARLYGIPATFSGGPGNALFTRVDLMEAAGIAMPTTVEELLEACRKWSDDANGKWAFGAVDWILPQLFGLVGDEGWSWDEEQGKLVNDCEKPEFTELLEFRRTLWDEKLIHPDAPTGTLDNGAMQIAGTTLFSQENPVRWYEYAAKVKDGTATGAIAPVPPIGAKGRKPTLKAGTSVDGWTFLNKDLSREQVEELLDVANWCSAPFGTKENELLEYGVEGEHFEYDATGNPVHTEHGQKVVLAPVNLKQYSGKVQRFLTGIPEVVQAHFEFNASCQEFIVPSIFEGVRIEAPAAAKSASQTFNDQQNDIAYGRADLSTIPDIVATFMANGGEEARGFYTDIYKSLNEQ